MENYKKDFPIFENDPSLVYLDSAASALKSKKTIELIRLYYENLSVNINRGVYNLSYEATNLYERTREKVAKFINASLDEIVFTSGATASLNLVALAYEKILKKGDVILTTEAEHHSSSMPWRYIASRINAKIEYIPLDTLGRVTIENVKKALHDQVKVIAIHHVSNVLGYVTPIKEIIKMAHAKGIIVSLDAAQSAPHMPLDVKDLDVDFLAFSAHKMAGPTGLGILYGKKYLLDRMDPIFYGGDMADVVNNEIMTYKDVPHKFEAGTPSISAVIALYGTISYLEEVGMQNIYLREKKLKEYTFNKLQDIQGITIYNNNLESNLITFNLDGIHPHDASSIFAKNNVCLRAGVHCAQPIHQFLKIDSSIRCSFYFYNDYSDCDKFILSVKEAISFFNHF